MKVFHYSAARFQTLRISKSQTGRAECWVCDIWNTKWAKEHAEKRHKKKAKYLYTFRIPNRKLFERWPGVYCVKEDIKVQTRRKVECQ
jgi:hypothetical protein